MAYIRDLADEYTGKEPGPHVHDGTVRDAAAGDRMPVSSWRS
ncbi:hypothetical protein [Amycolatopsis sp. GA6-003]